jgi:hypothetical protein
MIGCRQFSRHTSIGFRAPGAESRLLLVDAISPEFAAFGTCARRPIINIGVNLCVTSGSMLRSSAVSRTVTEFKSP